MDPRQPPQHHNHPFSQRNAASPHFSRSPFPPSTAPTPAQSVYTPTSHPPPNAPPGYQDHHNHLPQRRPSDPHYFSQTRTYPEQPAHPTAGHSRHPSASAIQSGSHPSRPMPPPPNSPPQQGHGLNAHQTGYGLPPPRPPAVSVGPPTTFPSGRELPALGSIARTGSSNSSMSISSMLGGPAPSRDPAPPSQYPAPSTTAGAAGPTFAPAVHASPRMHPNHAEYAQYRRPQTPDRQRPYDVRADPRGSAATSPQAMYPTPEVPRYGTPQGYSQRLPPPPIASNEQAREQTRMASSIPPRPSSQPKSFPGLPPSRTLDHGRPGPGPPTHHEAMYPRREEPPPSGEYNPERPIRVPKYEEQPRYMSERERQDREREMEFRERERRELERRDAERREAERRDLERREMESQAFERLYDRRDMERRDMERREMERRDQERREMERRELGVSGAEPGRPPPIHGQDYGHHSAPRGQPPQGYGRQPDPRDHMPWNMKPYEHAPRPYDPAGHPAPPPRHPDYPPTTAPSYGSHHPQYTPQQPLDRYPPSSHPNQAPTSAPPSSAPHRPPPHPHPRPQPQPYDSPDRQRHILHAHPQQPPPDLAAADGPPPRSSVAYGSGQGGPLFDSPRSRVMEEQPPPQREPPRGLLAIQEINRKGRISPLPQAVQGAQPQLPGPASEPGIKSEFGRMFSGIGSGVGALSSPVPAGAQLPFATAGLARKDDSDGTPHDGSMDGTGKPSRENSRSKRRSKIKEEENRIDDDGSGRLTPVGRTKRAKTHTHAHAHAHGHTHAHAHPQHRHHHHHHHHHNHATEAHSSASSTPFKSVKGVAGSVPSPTAIGALHHHHHVPPRSSAQHTHKSAAGATNASGPAAAILPKPKQVISSKVILDSVADKPRRHLGDVLYEVSLTPARFHDPNTGRPPRSAFKSTPKPLPMEVIKGKENCTLTVKISKVHLVPAAREEITSRRALWGTDVYTDDSDVVAACIHGGWIRGEWPEDVDVDMLCLYPEEPAPAAAHGRSKKTSSAPAAPTSEHLPTPDVLTAPLKTGPVNIPPDKDLHVTVLILPRLELYASTVRYGIRSREWGGSSGAGAGSLASPASVDAHPSGDGGSSSGELHHSSAHDGLSFKVLALRWVTNGAGAQSRLRGRARRERMHQALREVELSRAGEIGGRGPQGDPRQRAAAARVVAEAREACFGGGGGNGDGGGLVTAAAAAAAAVADHDGDKENRPLGSGEVGKVAVVVAVPIAEAPVVVEEVVVPEPATLAAASVGVHAVAEARERSDDNVRISPAAKKAADDTKAAPAATAVGGDGPGLAPREDVEMADAPEVKDGATD